MAPLSERIFNTKPLILTSAHWKDCQLPSALDNVKNKFQATIVYEAILWSWKLDELFQNCAPSTVVYLEAGIHSAFGKNRCNISQGFGAFFVLIMRPTLVPFLRLV